MRCPILKRFLVLNSIQKQNVNVLKFLESYPVKTGRDGRPAHIKIR